MLNLILARALPFRVIENKKMTFNEKDLQSLQSFVNDNGLIIPQHEWDDWRMTKPELGQLRGQPHLGTCCIRATDGVHALVEVLSKEPVQVLEAHIENWQGELRPQGWSPPVYVSKKQVLAAHGVKEKKVRKPRKTKKRLREQRDALRAKLRELFNKGEETV